MSQPIELKLIEEKYSKEMIVEAQTLIVNDTKSLILAYEKRAVIKKYIDAIETALRPKINNAWKVHGDWMDLYKGMREPFLRSDKIITDKINHHQTELKEKEIIAKRIEDERIKKIEAEKKAEIQKQIDEANKKGNLQEVRELNIEKEQVQEIPKPVVFVPEKIELENGGSGKLKRDIEIEIKDYKLVLQSVIDGTLSQDMIEVNLKKAKAFIKAFDKNDDIMKVPEWLFKLGFYIKRTWESKIIKSKKEK